MAGAYLSLAELGSYNDTMTGGRGFVALALVIFGGWNPFRVLAGGMLFTLALACPNASGQSTATNQANVRYEAVDVYVDANDKPLAAYQLEFKAGGGEVKIVGIEGGEHPAFREAPFYDPKAIQQERVLLAAFSTRMASELPKGRTRVATIHIQVGGTTQVHLELKLHVAADAQGSTIQAEATFVERKPQ